MSDQATEPDTAVATAPAPKRSLLDRIPVIHQFRQSVGLQRGMLVAGLIITGSSSSSRSSLR